MVSAEKAYAEDKFEAAFAQNSWNSDYMYVERGYK